MVLPSDPRYQGIIDDLKEGRLSRFEIAAKRLGNGKRKGEISKIATANNIPPRTTGRPKQGGFTSKVSNPKSGSRNSLKMETFEPELRLALIDEAITIHKSLLPFVTDSYKMDKWSAGLERLLEQRRMEEAPHSDGEQEMLDKIVGALDKHAESVSQKTSPSISGLPEESSNPDVRLGEERQN